MTHVIRQLVVLIVVIGLTVMPVPPPLPFVEALLVTSKPAPVAQVLYPRSLADLGPLSARWALFGPRPLTAAPLVGALVPIDGQACEPAGSVVVGSNLSIARAMSRMLRVSPSLDSSIGALVVVERGGCSFSAKARVLQNMSTADGVRVAGVIVADANARHEEDLLVPEDDGMGWKVRVPLLLVGRSTVGQLLEPLRRRLPVLLSLGVRV